MSDPRPVRFLPDFADAAGAYARAADWLGRGAESPEHPFHWLTLATADADGVPHARTVVLREFDAGRRAVLFHCDARSPKVAHLRHQPRVGLLLHDADARFQVRMTADAGLHAGDDVARRLWASASDSARAGYATPHAAGDPLPADAPTAPPPAGDAAFANFVAVVCRVREMDLLELHPAGQRRARLLWEGNPPTVRIRRIAP